MAMLHGHPEDSSVLRGKLCILHLIMNLYSGYTFRLGMQMDELNLQDRSDLWDNYDTRLFHFNLDIGLHCRTLVPKAPQHCIYGQLGKARICPCHSIDWIYQVGRQSATMKFKGRNYLVCRLDRAIVQSNRCMYQMGKDISSPKCPQGSNDRSSILHILFLDQPRICRACKAVVLRCPPYSSNQKERMARLIVIPL